MRALVAAGAVALLLAGCASASSVGAGSAPGPTPTATPPASGFGANLAGVPSCGELVGHPVVGVRRCHITTLVVPVTITPCKHGPALRYFGSPQVDNSYFAVGHGPLQQLPVTITRAYSRAYNHCTR